MYVCMSSSVCICVHAA